MMGLEDFPADFLRKFTRRHQVGVATGALVVRTPDGLERMGILSAASTLKNLILVLPGIIGRVSVPILVGLRGGLPSRYLATSRRHMAVMIGAAALTLAVREIVRSEPGAQVGTVVRTVASSP